MAVLVAFQREWNAVYDNAPEWPAEWDEGAETDAVLGAAREFLLAHLGV